MMHRSRWAACACAVVTTVIPLRADSAGVYENAATESALLVAPPRIAVRATVEYGSSDDLDARVYRVLGTFPVRSWFLFWVEMPFVSVSEPDGIESGPGDLLIRGRARVWGGEGRALALLSTLGTGSGNRRFFPYSSQTLDIGAAVGFVDSLGALHPFAIAGYQWVSRLDESRYTDDARPADHARATVGADIDLSRGGLRGGVVFHRYDTSAKRSLVFAGGSYEWTPQFRLLAEGQVELGTRSQRVGDWSLTAGLAVSF